MIHMKVNAIRLGTKEFHLTGFEVWWQGPLGMVPTREEAEELIAEDVEFLDYWRAVPVAVSRGTNDQLLGYEALP